MTKAEAFIVFLQALSTTSHPEFSGRTPPNRRRNNSFPIPELEYFISFVARTFPLHKIRYSILFPPFGGNVCVRTGRGRQRGLGEPVPTFRGEGYRVHSGGVVKIPKQPFNIPLSSILCSYRSYLFVDPTQNVLPYKAKKKR